MGSRSSSRRRSSRSRTARPTRRRRAAARRPTRRRRDTGFRLPTWGWVGVVVGGVVLLAAVTFLIVSASTRGEQAAAPTMVPPTAAPTTAGATRAPAPTAEQSEEQAVTPTERPVSPPRVGKPVPDFTLELLDGSSLTLSDTRGKVTVVNFWATWCPPCASELPDFQTVWEEYQDKDVVFIGVAVQGDSERREVESMVSHLGLTYPLGLDSRGEISFAYRVTGVPETLVLDDEGVVAYKHIGQVSAAMLREELNSLLGDG